MIGTKMKVPYIQLGSQHQPIREELLEEIGKLLDSGMFILGDAVSSFERAFAELCGTKYAVGVGNGTDTMVLCLQAWGIGPGDEVITAPNSYLASGSCIALAGATPVFADVRDDFNLDPASVEAAITDKTKAIIPVHLTGRPANMDAINAIAERHNLKVLEDAAQAVGAQYKGKPVGGLADAASFSLHPLKNLSAIGDAGIVTTNDKDLYEHLLKARTHGHVSRDEVAFFSMNSRLDAVQAAVLNVKIRYVSQWNDRRRAIAAYYTEQIGALVHAPSDTEAERAVYHTYIIQTDQRDALQQHLKEHGVDSKIHYPIPIHLQEAAQYLGYKQGDFPVTERQTETILSLPVFPELEDAQVEHVAQTIKDFFA